jgi:hypothetical protein
MPRIIHIKDGFKVNTSIAGDGWVEPADGSQMLEGDPRLNGIEWAAPPSASSSPSPEVSMLAMRMALARMKLYIPVTAAINAIQDPDVKLETQIWWTNSNVVKKEHPVVQNIAAALGKTNEEINAVFAMAQQIDAEI